MSRASAIQPAQFTTFGQLLRFLRQRAGLTQRELSIAAGYSESQMSRLEQNQRAPDQAAVAARFVPALHLENEPDWAARLLELGSASRAEGPVEAPASTGEAPLAANNLPVQLTSFVGRETELAEVQRLLAGGTRLLTLTGPGGTGKTRLALETAAGLLATFPDGVWCVELAPLADPALIPQTVASVLGVQEEPDRPILATLTAHMRRKRALLILDNCEHLIQACAQFAEAVLGACPHVCLLATSRELLSVGGERAVAVPSLQTPEPNQAMSSEQLRQYDAVHLFLDRVTTTAPHFALTRDNAAAVAEVCRRLDGIPLALELAAARLRMMPVEKLAARLGDVFQLLTGGSRTALPRHQTLTALIDWSYDLLPPLEQTLLRRLAVFAGGWTLEAAEAVCAGHGLEQAAVADLLGRLIDKSLVQAEQPEAARYQMLETIRHYALAKLAASGEADDLRRQHLLFYLALAEGGAGTPFESWLAVRKTELDNLRAAVALSQSEMGSAELGLRLAGVLGQVFSAFGYEHEGQGWLEQALAHPEAGLHPEAQALAFWNLGSIVQSYSYAQAAGYWGQSLKLYQKAGNTMNVANLLRAVGRAAREQGDAATARLRLEESLALYRRLEDKDGLIGALVTLAEVAVMQEDTEGATRLLEEARPIIIAKGDDFMQGWLLNHLGHAAQIQGQYERATRLHKESLPVFEATQSVYRQKLGVAWAHQGLGETALAQGQTAIAARHLREALAIFQDLGDRAGVAWCLAGLAAAAALDEDPERAAWLWGAGEKLRLSLGVREAPCSHTTHERLKAQTRKQLGEAAFAAEWAAGEAAPLSEAIERALS